MPLLQVGSFGKLQWCLIGMLSGLFEKLFDRSVVQEKPDEKFFDSSGPGFVCRGAPTWAKAFSTRQRQLKKRAGDKQESTPGVLSKGDLYRLAEQFELLQGADWKALNVSVVQCVANNTEQLCRPPSRRRATTKPSSLSTTSSCGRPSPSRGGDSQSVSAQLSRTYQ